MLTLGGRTPMRVAAPEVVRSMSAQPSPRATARSRSAWPRVASLPPVRQPLSELLAVGTDAGRLTRAELGPSCACPDSAPVVCLSNFWSRPDYLFALPSRYGQVVAKLCLSNLEPQSRAANPRRLCLSTLAPGPSYACPTSDPAAIACLHCHLGFAKLRQSCACPISSPNLEPRTRAVCACPHSRQGRVVPVQTPQGRVVPVQTPHPLCACPTSDPAPITCLHCHLDMAKLWPSCACPILSPGEEAATCRTCEAAPTKWPGRLDEVTAALVCSARPTR